MPQIAFYQCANINNSAECQAQGASVEPDVPLPDNLLNLFRRSYYGAVSYTDAQIGKVLDTLEILGLKNNTIVVFWGDHGWQLGEHGEWCKMTNFEVATHAPLIFRVPWKPNSVGARTKSIIEFLDIYPTLSELAGLRIPPALEGKSQAQLFDDPSVVIKQFAISQYPRCCKKGTFQDGKCSIENTECGGQAAADTFLIMGYTIRKDTWRYTEWFEWDKQNLKPIITNPIGGAELYNHTGDNGDLNEFENVNIANNPDVQDVVKDLQTELHSHLLQYMDQKDSEYQ